MDLHSALPCDCCLTVIERTRVEHSWITASGSYEAPPSIGLDVHQGDWQVAMASGLAARAALGAAHRTSSTYDGRPSPGPVRATYRALTAAAAASRVRTTA